MRKFQRIGKVAALSRLFNEQAYKEYPNCYTDGFWGEDPSKPFQKATMGNSTSDYQKNVKLRDVHIQAKMKMGAFSEEQKLHCKVVNEIADENDLASKKSENNAGRDEEANSGKNKRMTREEAEMKAFKLWKQADVRISRVEDHNGIFICANLHLGLQMLEESCQILKDYGMWSEEIAEEANEMRTEHRRITRRWDIS